MSGYHADTAACVFHGCFNAHAFEMDAIAWKHVHNVMCNLLG